MAAALIFSLRALSRTRHKLAEAHAERAQQELTIRSLRGKLKAAECCPTRWIAKKHEDKIAIVGEHYNPYFDSYVHTTIKEFYFSETNDDYAALLADELLEKLEEME